MAAATETLRELLESNGWEPERVVEITADGAILWVDVHGRAFTSFCWKRGDDLELDTRCGFVCER